MPPSLLPDTSPEGHAELLHHYNPDNKPWSQVPDDGYLYDHLVEHLRVANWYEGITALFADDRWLQIRVPQGGYEGYLRDLDSAWDIAYQQASQQITQDHVPTALINCAQYMLIQVSINSIMANCLPALTQRALETGLRTVLTGRAIANSSDTEPGEELSEEDRGVVTSVSQDIALDVLAQISPALSDALRANLYDAINEFANPDAVSSVLGEAFFHHEDEGHDKTLESRLNKILTISNELNRANALSQLAEHLSGDLIDQALDAVAAIQQEKWRPRVLASLSTQANDSQLARIFMMALDIQDAWHQAFALEGLVHYARPDLQDQTLRAILAIDDDEGFSRTLQYAGYLFSGELLTEALTKARAFTQDEYRSVALAGIANQFPPNQRDMIWAEAKQTAEQIDDPQSRTRSMAALAATANEADLVETLTEQLAAITHIADDEERSRYLVTVIPNLPDTLLADALDIALSIDKVNESISYSWAMETLAPRLEGELLKRALNDAVNIADGADRVATLVQLYTHADSLRQHEVARFAFESMMAIQTDWVRAGALGEVFEILDEGQREEALAQALSILSNLPHNQGPIKMMTSIAAALEGVQKQEVVDRTWELMRHIFTENENTRAFLQSEGIPSFYELDDKPAMLVMLAGQMEEPERDALLQEALDIIEGNADKWLFIEWLASIAKLARGELIERVIAVAKETRTPYSHETYTLIQVYEQLAERLTDEQLADALTLAVELAHPLSKAQLLGALLPRLAGKQKENAVAQMLTAALTIENAHVAADLCLRLISKLTGTARKQAIVRGLEKARQLEKEYRLRYLISYLPFADDDRTLLPNIRHDLLETLAEIRSNETREGIFSLYQMLFKSTVPPLPAAQISDHLIAVCRDWQWPA